MSSDGRKGTSAISPQGAFVPVCGGVSLERGHVAEFNSRRATAAKKAAIAFEGTVSDRVGSDKDFDIGNTDAAYDIEGYSIFQRPKSGLPELLPTLAPGDALILD